MKIFSKYFMYNVVGYLRCKLGTGEEKAYRLFDANGKEGYREMMKSVENQDVVFLGEVHNCAIAHWMEYEIVKDLCEVHKGKLAIDWKCWKQTISWFWTNM